MSVLLCNNQFVERYSDLHWSEHQDIGSAIRMVRSRQRLLPHALAHERYTRYQAFATKEGKV